MNTDEIKARLEAATEGKWDNSTNERSEHPSVIYTDIDDEGSLIVAECRTVKDGDFIAHAPTDIKWLLEEVNRLRNKIDDVCENCIHWDSRSAIGIGRGACPYDSKEHEPKDTCNNCEI